MLLLAACSDPGRPPQHEVTAAGELLTDDGRLREPGWSRRQLQHWDAARVHDPARLRQWDFFSVESDAAAVNLTLVDLGFAQVASVGVVDFKTGTAHGTSWFAAAGDAFVLSPAVEGAASLTVQGAAAPTLAFTTTADTTTVAVDVPSSLLGDAAKGGFTIHRRPSMEYLSLATPFSDDPHQFFYEQKIPGMSADGMLTIGGDSYAFAADGASATMDWGRGEWPPTVTWRWAAATGTVDGKPLAFNLGEGFGDATAGTENVVVSADVANKLAEVDWSHDPNDLMKDWTFHARDGRLALTLHPLAQEVGGLDFGAKYSHLHKAYGRFSGTIVLDDGRAVTVDNLLGFAEEEELAW